MTWEERIAVDPAVLAGKPIIKGTRIAVEFLIDLLAQGWSYDQILGNYPQLSHEDILAALDRYQRCALLKGKPVPRGVEIED